MIKNSLKSSLLAVSAGVILGWSGHLLAADNSAAAMNAYMDSMKRMDAGMKTAMDTMHKDMKASADHHFVTMMISHHAGAVDMAKIELKYGSDPRLRKMAQQIVSSQTKEIDDLKKWQKSHAMK